SNFAATECDLLIAVGTRFSDRAIGKVEGFAPEAKILQIDIDPAEINKNIRINYSIIGSVNKVLNILNQRIEVRNRTSWLAQVDEWKKTYPLNYKRDGL